jgi:hypothetical protein
MGQGREKYDPAVIERRRPDPAGSSVDCVGLHLYFPNISFRNEGVLSETFAMAAFGRHAVDEPGKAVSMLAGLAGWRCVLRGAGPSRCHSDL